MKRIVVIFLLSLAAGTYTFSQQISIGFSSGVGTYAMDDLKSLNEAVHPVFDTKLVTDFPPYWFYQPSLLIKLHKVAFGLNYTFQSTGSRISAKDYSGEYRLDMKVHSNNLGLVAAVDLLEENNLRFSVYLEPGMAFSDLKINEYLILLDTELENETMRFKALNYYVEPGIEFTYTLFPEISLGLNLGYYFQAGKRDFHLDGEKDILLTNPSTRETIKPGWSGIRLGMTLTYDIL